MKLINSVSYLLPYLKDHYYYKYYYYGMNYQWSVIVGTLLLNYLHRLGISPIRSPLHLSDFHQPMVSPTHDFTNPWFHQPLVSPTHDFTNPIGFTDPWFHQPVQPIVSPTQFHQYQWFTIHHINATSNL